MRLVGNRKWRDLHCILYTRAAMEKSRTQTGRLVQKQGVAKIQLLIRIQRYHPAISSHHTTSSTAYKMRENIDLLRRFMARLVDRGSDGGSGEKCPRDSGSRTSCMVIMNEEWTQIHNLRR